MSFNIGNNPSRYVAVSNVTMRYSVSEKMLFADLRTSKRTGRPKHDKETGEVVLDKQGKPVPERVYTHWEGRFVGKAFEPAKALRNGTYIDIVKGWTEKEEITSNGKTYTTVYIVISDFNESSDDMKNFNSDIEDDELPFDTMYDDSEGEG
ncbi:MAG: hypothetical protein PHI19_00070 [Clostridia bacterium]|jgi:hypothetical protein|nr:hypothetical protein [Clostridia bacterium]